MVGRALLSLVLVLMLAALSGCGDLTSRRARSYQPLPQNLPSNATVESPNSRPP
jgi:hypothetical protein